MLPIPKCQFQYKLPRVNTKVTRNLSCCSRQLHIPNFGALCPSFLVRRGLFSAAETTTVTGMGGQASGCVDFPIIVTSVIW